MRSFITFLHLKMASLLTLPIHLLILHILALSGLIWVRLSLLDNDIYWVLSANQKQQGHHVSEKSTNIVCLFELYFYILFGKKKNLGSYLSKLCLNFRKDVLSEYHNAHQQLTLERVCKTWEEEEENTITFCLKCIVIA